MKSFRMMFVLGLVLLILGSGTVTLGGEVSESYSLWIGGHVTDFSDNNKKVGEYLKFDEDPFPELRLDYLSQFDNGYFSLKGHYFDDENINARVHSVMGDRLRADFQYRSLLHQIGQDLLSNLEAREFLPETGSAGGKMLTHELLDPGADYNVHRQEILANVSGLLSRKNNVRLWATHRTILKEGSDQAISSNHCFSCHQVSQTQKVESRQHQFEIGLDGTVNKIDLGYSFGYRKFESDAPPSIGYYDEAKHPVNGGSGAEFASRVQWDDTTLVLSSLPETEKISHKVRAATDVGKGRVVGKLGYSRTENKGTKLQADALTGALKYTVPLNEKTRLITSVAGARLTADDVFVDARVFRDGRPGLQYDADFTRYSALDRYDGRASAEVITRLNPRMMLSILGGVNIIDRDDYTIPGDGLTTTKLYGQAKLRYRKSPKYNTSLKYRFETISDPFLSSKGLFEFVGRDSLPALPGAPSNLRFYFQREDIRYQDITSQPTQVQSFAWRSNYMPRPDVTIGIGVKGQYDKNGDLDSLDVNHFSLVPDVILNYMPGPKWALTTGYTYQFDKSRIPVAVALFDG